MLDLMPSTSLIFHEWGRHGTCSGLSARAYFDTIRKARATVKIPEQYLSLNDTLTGDTGRGGGGFPEGQSRHDAAGNLGGLQRPPPSQRGEDLRRQGPSVPRLRRGRSASRAGLTR